MNEVVLLVEDNEDDFEITRLAFQRAKLAVQLHRVSNGEDCMAFLRREGPHAGAPTPHLILLDLNMPRMNGIEVLQELGKDDKLAHLVVVVLTSSSSDRDVLRAYQLRCSSYLVKPMKFDDFTKMIQMLGAYWFTLATLPPSA